MFTEYQTVSFYYDRGVSTLGVS